MKIFDPDIKIYDPDDIVIYDPDAKTSLGKRVMSEFADYGSRVLERGKQIGMGGAEAFMQVPEIIPSLMGARSFEDLLKPVEKTTGAVMSIFTPLMMAGAPISEAVRRPATTALGERAGEAIAGGLEAIPALASGQGFIKKPFTPLSIGKEIRDIPLREWSTQETSKPPSPKGEITSPSLGVGESPASVEAISRVKGQGSGKNYG